MKVKTAMLHMKKISDIRNFQAKIIFIDIFYKSSNIYFNLFLYMKEY
jgi:hypothetical protein